MWPGVAVVVLWAAVAEAAIPPHEEAARVARFVAHSCDWGALATLSAQEPPMRGQPFANVFSLSDGPAGSRGSGVPYLYLTALEVSVRDLQMNANASLTMSLAQTPYCKKKGYDPQSPLCAHVIFSGLVEKLSKGHPEHTSSQNTDTLYNKLSPGRRDEYDSLGVKKTDDDIEMGGKKQHRRNKSQDRVYTSLQRDKMGEAYSEIGKKGERRRGKGNDTVYQGLSAATKDTYDVLQMQPVQTPY